MMLVYCGALLLLVVGAYSDKSVTVGDITTHVKGHSGKIAIYKGSNVSDGVTITFDSIQEISTTEDKITKHSYNNFAQLAFTFSDSENSTYPESNVSVVKFNFTSTMTVESNPASTLTSYIYIFTSDGNITVDGSDTMVKSGDVKFNVEIQNWPFCDTCEQKNSELIGKYLDFSIEIKGKKELNSSTASSTGGNFDLGGATVFIPTQVIYDESTTKDMPSGYPKVVTQGSKSVFVFRFETFNSSVLYDPTVSLGADGDDTNEGGDGDETTERELKAAGITTKVRGKSGKITLSAETSGDSSQNSITVEFDNLEEKKSDGVSIADSNNKFNNFANQDFVFSEVVDDTYPGTNVEVQRITFQSNLTNNALLKIDLYSFKADAEITQGDETLQVLSGNIKFNIDINGWPFCSGTNVCKKAEVGEYLDFDIVIKGNSGDASKKDSDTGKGEKYGLGTSGDVTLSKKITVDGATDFVNMADGYPLFDSKGSKQIFRFRFPKFNTSVSYDPIVSLNSSSTALVSTFSVAVMCLLLQWLY